MRHHFGKSLRLAMLIVLIAVVVGPFMAGLCLFVLMIVDSMSHSPAAILAAPQLLFMAIFMSYWFGALIAFVAAIFISVWMIWRPVNLFVVLLASLVAISTWFFVVDPHALLEGRSTAPGNVVFAVVASGMLAATGCWYLVCYVRGRT